MLLILILLLGGYLRFNGMNWDNFSALHPDERFLTLENVILQPHHASGTVETRQAMGKLVRDNLAAHFARQPLLTPVI